MAAGSDVRDILELEQAPEKEMVTKESLMYDGKKVSVNLEIYTIQTSLVKYF